MTAGVAARRDVSCRRLQRDANRLAHRLTSRGVRRGDRVGVLRPQSAWTAAAHIAAWKLGAVSVPLFSLFAGFEVLHEEPDFRRYSSTSRGSLPYLL